MNYDKILLEHGGGGLLSNELIAEKFLPHFNNAYLERLEDSAVLTIGSQKFCFTTDSYVVSPIFFPGGTSAPRRCTVLSMIFPSAVENRCISAAASFWKKGFR